MSQTITASPAAVYATTPFSDAEKADVRRFCGYPTYGQGSAGFQSWRFFQEYGLLEFRMNNLAAAELQNARYYLAQLYPLEAAVWSAGANMGTDQAAVWTRNKDEAADRTRLFKSVCRTLCNVVGVPAGPNLMGGQSVRCVV